MRTKVRALGGALLAVLLGAGLTACSDSTGPEGSGTATIQMARLGSSSASMAASVVGADPRMAELTVEEVDAINVIVDRVEAHRVGSEQDSTPGGWFGIAVEETDLDLKALSTEQALTIASDTLPAGTYDQVRLFLAGATVDFADGVDPDGDGPIAESEDGVELRIPSSEQTGLKVPDASFTLEAEATSEVTILFDEGTSVQNITFTGAGEVILNPVLVAGDETSGGS